MITEDSAAGNQFYRSFFHDEEACISAGGNGKIYRLMKEQECPLLVVADGAAFGAFVARVLEYAKQKGDVLLYFPESFEWLILQSRVIAIRDLEKILEHPEDYIDSSEYMSWERFFTVLLEENTKEDAVRRYQKNRLPQYYLSARVSERILRVMPEKVRMLLLYVQQEQNRDGCD